MRHQRVDTRKFGPDRRPPLRGVEYPSGKIRWFRKRAFRRGLPKRLRQKVRRRQKVQARREARV